MRAAFVFIALFCGAVWAGSNEVESITESSVDSITESESELSVPTLPGLGAGCLPKYAKRNYRDRRWSRHVRAVESYGGVCTADNGSCPEAQVEHGYCAGLNVVCCKNAAAIPSVAAPAVTIPAVATIPTAVAPATPAPAAVAPATPVPASPVASKVLKAGAPATAMTKLVAIPSGINSGLTMAGASFQTTKLGKPGCPLTKACFSCTCAVQNALIKRNIITLAVTPSVRITGLSPFVNAVKKALDNMKAAGARRPELLTAYNSLRSAGGLCCRAIKKSNGTPGSSWSNHSWGVAVDFYFGNTIDPRGDGKTQYGLSLMAPFFRDQQLYWAAGFRGSEEDAMHFEASQQALNAWTAAKLIR